MVSKGTTVPRGDHRCDTCRTSFDCKTLATTLKVLAAHEDEIRDPELKQHYEAIKKMLADGGWAYPDGGRLCIYASLPREVQGLTSQLVQLWQRSHFHPKNGDEHALFQEEVRSE